MEPDFCTSMSGCTPPQRHCPECSHALFYGILECNGKSHKFSFNPQYGVFFLTKSGEDRKVQPAEKNPVWDEFNKWYYMKFGR